MSVETSSEWFKGQRCPICHGSRGKVIAFLKRVKVGKYLYRRWTHRLPLRRGKGIEVRQDGSLVMKRLYCYSRLLP